MAQIQDERFQNLFPTVKAGQEQYYAEHDKIVQS